MSAEAVADPSLLADRNACGSFFHLNPRAGVEGGDCGDVLAGGPDAPAPRRRRFPRVEGS